ncbi:MAG: phage regulatory protein [Pseudomonadota bacterium]|jgi:hypothetical protein
MQPTAPTPTANQCDDIASVSELIDALGGTMAVARLCEVSSQAVTQWRRSGIPRARIMYLRLRCPQAFQLPVVERAAT